MLIGEKKKIVALTVFLFIFLKITSSILDAQIKKLGWDQLTSISIARITSKSSTLKAAFSYTPIFPVSGLPIQFYDKSSGNPDKWSWDFGDGSFSSEKNPTHIYNTSGYFIVSLTVEFNGTTSKISRKIRVLAGANKTSSEQKVGELTANFVFQPAVTEEGMEVQFTDMSTGNPTSWNWNFGDGGTSSEKNPKHIYTKSGTYNITLEVSNGAVTKNTVKQITVVSSLIPDFSYSPDQPEVGQSVQFVDVTVGNPVNWAWDFGDGDSSTLRNPIHVYNQPGLYKVTLKVSNSYFTKFVSKTISIKSLPVV
ncbi:MAG: PKD domain-containing protein, partial [Candidatus Saccharicenans sp.]